MMRSPSALSRMTGQASMIVFILIIVLAVLVVNIGAFSTIGLLKVFVALTVFLLAFLKTDFAIVVLIFSMLLSPEIAMGRISDRAVILRFDDIFLFVIFLGWLAKLAIFKELGLLKKTPLNGPIFIYILACLFSTAVTLIQGHGSVARSFFYLAKYFEYFLVYFLVVNNIESFAQVKTYVGFLLLTCFIVSVYALVFYFSTGVRATAPFEGPQGEANTLAGYLVLLMALMMGLFLYHDSARMRLGLVVALPLAFLALVFSLSRSGWISFMFMYLVFIFVSKKSKPFLLFGFILMLVLAPFVAPSVVHQRVDQTFKYGKTYRLMGKSVRIDESGAARLEAWKIGFKKVMEKPIFGHGIPTGSVVDNQYARVMTETGLVGLAAFLFLLMRIFHVEYYQVFANEENGFARGLAVGFLAGFFGILVHCLSAATFILIRVMEPFWFLTAIVVLLPELAKKAQRETPAPAFGGT